MGNLLARGSVAVNNWPWLPCIVKIDQDMIDVTCPTDTVEPDPRWVHVDRNGHYHGYASDGGTPTLELHGCPDEQCQECLDGLGWLACVICGARVVPKTRVVTLGGTVQYLPGQKTSVIEASRVPADHPFGRLLMKSTIRLARRSDRDALSVVVDFGPTRLHGGGFEHRGMFGIGWPQNVNVTTGEVGPYSIISAEIGCKFLEEIRR